MEKSFYSSGFGHKTAGFVSGISAMVLLTSSYLCLFCNHIWHSLPKASLFCLAIGNNFYKTLFYLVIIVSEKK